MAGLVEPGGGPSAPFDSAQDRLLLRFAQDRLPSPLIYRDLWRAECVVELLLEPELRWSLRAGSPPSGMDGLEMSEL